MVTVTQGISATNRQFEAALSRGDATGCASVYTEDAKVMPPDNPLVTGRQAAQELWQGVINMGITGVSLQTQELEELSDDRAVERGVGTLEIQTEGGSDRAGVCQVHRILEAPGRWVVEVGLGLLEYGRAYGIKARPRSETM